VAERAADLILGRQPLPAAKVPVWIDTEWEQKQRISSPARRS
jgi:choline dehydrogenase